jgi:hypothetical protein
MVSLNVYKYGLWRAVRQIGSWESIPRRLKRFTRTGSAGFVLGNQCCNPHRGHWRHSRGAEGRIRSFLTLSCQVLRYTVKKFSDIPGDGNVANLFLRCTMCHVIHPLVPVIFLFKLLPGIPHRIKLFAHCCCFQKNLHYSIYGALVIIPITTSEIASQLFHVRYLDSSC